MKIKFLLFAAISFFVFKMSAQPCNLQALSTYTVISNIATFSNASTGTTTSTTYTWNLYSGYPGTNTPFTTTAITSSPYTYTANGQYLLCLIASNGATCSDTNFNVVNICVSSPAFSPTLSLTQSPGGVVSFTPEANGSSMVNRILQFGDNSNSSFGLTPCIHTYFNGTFTPSLIITFGPSSCEFTTTTAAITVTDNPCYANAAFTYTVGSGGVVQFSKITPLNNTNAYWNFGDGYASTLSNPSHTYSSAGNFHVFLETYPPNANYYNCHDTNSVNINISGIPCVANANFTILPTGQPHDYWIIPGNPYNVSSAIWNWGDGNTTNTGSYIYANHTYSAAGTYDVCLTVTASCGGSLFNTATYCSSQYMAKGTAGDMISMTVKQPQLIDGIEKVIELNSQFDLFPNPTSGELTLKLENETGVIEIEIYDLLGKKVYTESLKGLDISTKIDVSQLNNGIYFLQLKLPQKILSSKFIISK